MATSRPSRFVLPHFFSEPECKELEFIHKSCGVVGYRPFVLSTTLSHLVATNCAYLIIPVLRLRERLKEIVEERFGREYELFIEFTGLISWVKGATIGWHSDNNRTYLRQRHYSVCIIAPKEKLGISDFGSAGSISFKAILVCFTGLDSQSTVAWPDVWGLTLVGGYLKAVCYLNNYEQDFQGGVFHFQNGEPSSIFPSLGTVVMYIVDDQNVHCVDEITGGERCTLALWFTSDQAHDEDSKLIRQIAMAVPGLHAWPSDAERGQRKMPPGQSDCHPIAASSVMYDTRSFKNGNEKRDQGRSPEQSANLLLDDHKDLRVARLASMGAKCCSLSTVDDGYEHDRPVELFFKDHKVPYCFPNSLHALQVVQFHHHQSFIMLKVSAGFVEHLTERSEFEAMNTMADDSLPKSTANIGDCSRYTGRAICNREIRPHESYLGGAEDSCKEDDDILRSIWLHKCYTSNLWSRLFELFPLWRENETLLLNDR